MSENILANKMNTPICQQPWFEMQIEYNNNVGCCCYYHYPKLRWDFKKGFDVFTYWNSEFFKNLRKIVTNGNLSNTGCSDCASLRYQINYQMFSKIPVDLDKNQYDNYKKAWQGYANGHIEIGSLPVKYYLNCGLSCNLRCFMCSQKIDRSLVKDLLPIDLYYYLEGPLQCANEITLIGGEPFFLPNAIKLLELISSNDKLLNLKISIVTNGTLINKYFELLKRFKRLHIYFSLDAIGDSYETIRRGANWAKVERNILDFINLSKKGDYKWSVSAGHIIMKSTLPTLLNTIKWNIRNDIPVGFSHLCLQHYTVEENIIEYPELLSSITNWREIFDEALEMLTKKQWHNAVDNLKAIKRQIELNADKRLPRQVHLAVYEGLKSNSSKTPLVSIITICRNAMPYIKDCITSILSQDYPCIEYIVQDGGSTDGTVELLKSYGDRINWRSEPDSGHGEAMNRALKRCSGEIIGTCNADDILMPYAVSWAVDAFKAHPELAAVYGDYVEIDEKGNTRSLVIPGPNPYNYERVLCVEDVPPMQSAFFKKDALKEAGLLGDSWLPKHCEDFNIWANLGLKNKTIYMPGFVSKYRVHKASETNTPNVYKRFYISKRETLERFFLRPDVPESIRALRNRALSGLALSIAGMFLVHFSDLSEGFRYITLARSEAPDEFHLKHMGITIKKFDFLLSAIIRHGQGLLAQGKFAEAYAVFDLLKPVDYWYIGIHHARAICLKHMGRDEEALDALNMELTLHPQIEGINYEFFYEGLR